jgi:protein-tyrosine phosphatase
MKAQGKPILLHCHAGSGRTGTMLHAYYLAEGLDLAEAKIKVRTRKPSSQFFMLSDAQKAFLETFAALDKENTS